ncbi:MAG TPA: type II toxin-antitoxin system RelE/ParE family toxin [Thermoanaerobaculia bacterium]|jgi:mRNA-degrading endonuclease RelE of RelBE toxin-antitoxin system|nr:type II toxin-antitoxin system RelE/ParE family toxin [Thermoanaerobaculia bacterium]
MFRIEFTEGAIDDLSFLGKSEQRYVRDALKLQLMAEPHVRTRNRKPLRPNELATWELRIDAFRVFYDIDGGTVRVRAVGWKEHNRLMIRGQEFKL